MAFDKSTRNRLATFVSNARTLITEEFTQQFHSLYGITESGNVTPLENLRHLDESGLMTATLLRERIDYLVQTSSDQSNAKTAVERLGREQAFTVLNRLAAIRMAEKRELIAESVGEAYNSSGFRVFEKVVGSGLGDSYQRYRRYLFCLFDELAMDLGALFDRTSPQGLLFPREPALLSFLKLLNANDLDALWAEDETIGWIYQYYNDSAERKKMRESGAPRNSRELAVRNQFFTPRYVVEFLADNTLGRIWYEMTAGETRLRSQCSYLVHRPAEIFLKPGEVPPEIPSDENLSQEELLKQPVYIPNRPMKDPREIRLLDPACGSMHFGLYAFDLFETIYEEAWDRGLESLRKDFPQKSKFLREVPRLIIENNLHGIDIDPRAIQIAGLSIWLRGQKSWQSQKVPSAERPRILRSNLVCAEPMPGSLQLLKEFTATLKPPLLGQLVENIFDRMHLAGEAGSLLKVDEEIKVAIDETRQIWDTLQTKPYELFSREEINGMLGSGAQQFLAPADRTLSELPKDFWDTAEDLIYKALRAYSEQAESDRYLRRLFSDDTVRGFAFIDNCRKRYDIILMNPPFGDVPLNARDYIANRYTESKGDFGMAFISGLTEKLKNGGELGAITNRVFIANETLHNWRNDYLLGGKSSLDCLLDLGFGVLDDAKVETAAFVLNRENSKRSVATFVRVLDARDKESATLSTIRGKHNDNRAFTFSHRLESFYSLPGHVVAYQLPISLLRRITGGNTLSSLGGKTAVGLQPSDDFRFVRLAWEVSPMTIGPTKNWCYYAKGGEYQPYWDDIHLVVNWANDGAEIRNFFDKNGKIRSRPQNRQYYFKAGVTWPERTTSDFSARALPKDCIFSVVGQGIFCDTSNRNLAFISGAYSRAFKLILDAVYGSGDASCPGSCATHYRSGVISKLPPPIWFVADDLQTFSLNLVRWGMEFFNNDETSRYFTCGSVRGISINDQVNGEIRTKSARISKILAEHFVVESKTFEELGFDTADQHIVDRLIGPHPISYRNTISSEDVQAIHELWRFSESNLIRKASLMHGARRQLTMKSYVASRRYELVAHTLEVDARSVAMIVEKELFREPGLEAQIASNNLSWLLGAAFGRWDIRCATRDEIQKPVYDPFGALPVCAPGMLQNSLGLPACNGDLPANYPLKISWSGILVDDENNPENIVKYVEDALKVIWKDRWESIENEMCEILKVNSLTEYFRQPSAFFADHLERYSKSHRLAPIYWPLSTSNGSYTLWVYYHRLTENTLHTALADFVVPKLKSIRSEINSLRSSEMHHDRFEALTDFESELEEFRAEIERIVKLPWKPNLNDGVLITASPLWKLFNLPKWRDDLKKCWEKLDRGEYEWAHLAHSIWPYRVNEVCKTDRSIAIAHGLEHLCQLSARKPKTNRAKKSNAKLDELEL